MKSGGSLSLLPRFSPPPRGRRDGRPTRILVTGAGGLLGNRLAELAAKKGHEVFSAYKEHLPLHGEPVLLDITDEGAVRKTISRVQPQAIINTAALTDVDRCEAEPDLAILVNSQSVVHLANAAREAGAFLVQVSTDYVFNGERGEYSESDTPDPINIYGRSKLGGELASKSAGEGRWCISRTSVVYGWGRSYRPNAATYVHEKLSKGEKVSMVKDQYSSPTLNTSLGAMIIEVAERRISGIIHTAGATRLNRYDFALGLADTLGLDKKLISAVEAAQLSWKARRPRDSSLNVGMARRLLAQKPIEVREAYERFRKELVELKGSQQA